MEMTRERLDEVKQFRGEHGFYRERDVGQLVATAEAALDVADELDPDISPVTYATNRELADRLRGKK